MKASLKSLMGSVHVGVTAACQEYHERFRCATLLFLRSIPEVPFHQMTDRYAAGH